jgi:hypothetical protein
MLLVDPVSALALVGFEGLDGVSGLRHRAAHGQSIIRLQQATSAAVSTLLKVMVDASTPASTKVRAAARVLNHSAKAIEIEDIGVRVLALEAAAASGQERR